MVNLAVSVATPRIVTWLPIEPSLEPIASSNTTCGIRSRSASLTSVVHITPDDTIICRLEVSYGAPRSVAASIARTIGFENASPTIVLCVQRCRWIASSISSASRLRFVSVTTWPPSRWCIMAPSHRPVPCISGAPVIDTLFRPASCRPVTSGAIASADAGGSMPRAGNPSVQKNLVMPPMSYMTPFGIPVVPPV